MKPIPDMGLFFRTEAGNLVADNEYWATLVGGETAPNPSLVAVTPSASVPVPDYSAYGEEHDRSLALYQLPYPYLPPVAWGRQLGEPMAVYQTRVLIELAMLDLLSVDPASRRLQAVAVVDADTITSQGEQAAAWLGGGDWDTGDRLAKAFDARFAATFANGGGERLRQGELRYERTHRCEAVGPSFVEEVSPCRRRQASRRCPRPATRGPEGT